MDLKKSLCHESSDVIVNKLLTEDDRVQIKSIKEELVVSGTRYEFIENVHE